MEIKIVIDVARIMDSPRRWLSSWRVKLGLIVGIVSTPLLVYAAGISKPHTFVDGATISAAQVNANFDTVYNGVNSLDSRATALEAKNNWCFSCNPISTSTTSATWKDITDWPECVITTTGRPVLLNAEYSLYIANHHAGLRVVMDPGTSGARTFGQDATYGMDWQSHFPGTWIKRSMMHVLQNIPAGTHRFRMQWRSNAEGQFTQLHGGTCSGDVLYSGSKWFMQELK